MKVSTQSDKTYQILLEAIVTGDIAPGTRLREIDLAKEFGIGRGPLREALQRLESRKLVNKMPHVGAQVIAFDLKELVEIYQIRENLEGLACELAAQYMPDDAVKSLGGLLAKHSQFIDAHDGQSYIEQDTDLDFHFRIIQASNNEWLIRILCDELYHRVRMYRFQSENYRSRPRKALAEHYRIYDALKDRDGELASLLMRRHIAAARKAIEQRINESKGSKQNERRS